MFLKVLFVLLVLARTGHTTSKYIDKFRCTPGSTIFKECDIQCTCPPSGLRILMMCNKEECSARDILENTGKTSKLADDCDRVYGPGGTDVCHVCKCNKDGTLMECLQRTCPKQFGVEQQLDY